MKEHKNDCQCNECVNEEIGTEENNVIELIDEDGNAQPYEMLDYIENGKQEYIVITPFSEEEEEEGEECDVYIMRVVHEGEEDFFEVIDDQKELDQVFALFQQHMEEYDFAE